MPDPEHSAELPELDAFARGRLGLEIRALQNGRSVYEQRVAEAAEAGFRVAGYKPESIHDRPLWHKALSYMVGKAFDAAGLTFERYRQRKDRS